MEGYGRYRRTVADAGSMMSLAAQTFVGHRRCALTPLQAWHALAEFDQWLTALPTVTAVRVETHGPLLQIGTEYTVKTPEGPTLRARVTEVEALRRVHTTARLWLFR